MKFKIYKCISFDSTGKKHTDYKYAENEKDVLLYIKSKNLIIADIKEIKSYKIKSSFSDVLNFTQIMTQLLDAGLSIKDSLEVFSVIDKKEKGKIKIAEQLLEQINKGITFSQAVSNMPYAFSNLYRGIISVGDIVGSVERIFPRLKEYLEQTKKIKDKLSNTLIYPVLILFTSVLGFIALSFFVFPKLQLMFSEFGGDAADILNNNLSRLNIVLICLLFFLLCLLLSVSVLVSLSKKNIQLREKIDYLILKIPVLGKFLIYWNTLNFAFSMEVLTSGGIPIEKALEYSTSVLTNLYFKKTIINVRELVEKGISISSAFNKYSIFPDYISNWLIVGEKSGKTDKVFYQIRSYFQLAIDKYSSTFMALIEPALILLIGIIMIVFVCTIIIPVFSLYNSL